MRTWLGRRPWRGRGTGSRRLGWLAALTAVLVVAGGTALALSLRHPASQSAGTSGTRMPGMTGRATRGLSAAGAARVRAATWIARQVSRGAIVACDAVMCSSLYNEGLPAANLLVIGPSTPDPLGADLVVATPAVRGQLGSRLNSVYAPTVMASFGAGPTRVDIRVVAPYGAASYARQLRADLAARKEAGGLLLRNRRITLPARGVAQLAAGWIDSRLLLMLPVLAAGHPIRILGFGDRAPGSSPGVPLTSVELSAAGRVAGLSDRGYLNWLLGFLRDQRPPFRAASIQIVRHGGEQAVIVRFARPSPVGLLASG